jgi:hypothetical protein
MQAFVEYPHSNTGYSASNVYIQIRLAIFSTGKDVHYGIKRKQIIRKIPWITDHESVIIT